MTHSVIAYNHPHILLWVIYIVLLFFFFKQKTAYEITGCDWSSDVCFFFSSRRRHTRLQGDWSSDVCSSDLLQPMKQPVLNWYFETASTSEENRKRVLDAVRTASPQVRSALGLAEEEGRIVWWWPRLTLVARRLF